MSKLKTLLTRSRSINQFATVCRMNEDDVYEFYLECYLSYRDTFIERLKYGRQFKRVITRYRDIPEFKVLHPSDISRIVFTSQSMAYWFAFQFYTAIDNQVSEKRIDRSDLLIEMTFLNHIPNEFTMEDILNEQRKKSTTDLLLPERQDRPTQETEVGTRIAVDSQPAN